MSLRRQPGSGPSRSAPRRSTRRLRPSPRPTTPAALRRPGRGRGSSGSAADAWRPRRWSCSPSVPAGGGCCAPRRRRPRPGCRTATSTSTAPATTAASAPTERPSRGVVRGRRPRRRCSGRARRVRAPERIPRPRRHRRRRRTTAQGRAEHAQPRRATRRRRTDLRPAGRRERARRRRRPDVRRRTSEPAGPIDVNHATVDQLDELPGIGPATAAAIVDHREQNGPFATVDDLEAVSGIGPAKLEAIRDLVTVMTQISASPRV